MDDWASEIFEKKENMAWYTEGLNQLEEVKVTGKKRSKKFIRRKKLHEKYRSLVWDIGKYYEIPVPSEHKTFKDNLLSFLSFEQHVTLVNAENGEYYLKIPIKKEAILFVDGERLKSNELIGP